MAFTFDPTVDSLPVVDATTVNAAKSLVANLNSAAGSALVGNDFLMSSMNSMPLINATIGSAGPASPKDDQLWYDTVNHRLKYYDKVAAAWTVLTASRAKEITWIGRKGTISADRTYTVPTDFATPYDAEVFLRDYAIGPGVTVTVNINAGTYNHGANVMQGHPQGTQIFYIGAGYNAAVDVTALTCTGYSAAQRTADIATNTTYLTGKYKVRIDTTGNGAYVRGGNMLIISDVLFVGPTAGSNYGVAAESAYVEVNGVSTINYLNGFSFTQTFARSKTGSNVHLGARGYGQLVQNSYVMLQDVAVFSGSGPAGINANVGGILTGANVIVKGNVTGININNSSNVSSSGGLDSSYNSGSGVVASWYSMVRTTASSGVGMSNNGAYGTQCSFTSAAVIANAVITSNANYGLYITYQSIAYAIGANISNNASGGGIACSYSSYVAVNTATINNNTGYGIYSTQTSQVSADSAVINSNTSAGVRVTMNSNVYVSNATIRLNGGRGISMEMASVAYVSTSTVSSNTTHDLYASDMSYIYGVGVTGTPAPVLSPAANTLGNTQSYIRT